MRVAYNNGFKSNTHIIGNKHGQKGKCPDLTYARGVHMTTKWTSDCRQQ